MVVCTKLAWHHGYKTQTKPQETEPRSKGWKSCLVRVPRCLVQGGCLLASIRFAFSFIKYPVYTRRYICTRFDRHNNGHTASRMYTGHTWVDVRASHVLSLLQCDACKHRKIRCDKEDPCSNCRTTGASTGALFFCASVSGS